MRLFAQKMNDLMQRRTLQGYHGTNAENLESISVRGLVPSTGNHHWLGNGVYFFLSGISDPIRDAEEWASAEAWDNRKRCHRYNMFAVIRAEISSLRLLDLNSDEGKRALNFAREALENRCFDESCAGRFLGNPGFNDAVIIRLLIEQYQFDVCVYDFYIKSRGARILRRESRFANVRVACVQDPKCIVRSSITCVKQEKIQPYPPNDFGRV
jgi:hypothetical protein